MTKPRKYLPLLLVVAMLFGAFPYSALAAPLNINPQNGLDNIVKNIGGNFWDVVKSIMWVAFAIILLVIAFQFMFSGGDPNKIRNARWWILSGIIALILALYVDVIAGSLWSILGGK